MPLSCQKSAMNRNTLEPVKSTMALQLARLRGTFPFHYPRYIFHFLNPDLVSFSLKS